MVKHLSMWCFTDVACHRIKKPTTIPISKTIDKAIRLAPVLSLITRQHSLYKSSTEDFLCRKASYQVLLSNRDTRALMMPHTYHPNGNNCPYLATSYVLLLMISSHSLFITFFLRYNISQPPLEIRLMAGTQMIFQTSVICHYLSSMLSMEIEKKATISDGWGKPTE